MSPHPPLALGEVLFDLRADRLMDVLVQGRVACNPSQHRADTTEFKLIAKSHAWCLVCVSVRVKEAVLNVLFWSVFVYVCVCVCADACVCVFGAV